MACSMVIGMDYEEVQNMVFDAAHKLTRKYGGNFDEWLSEANWHFMKAYYTYDTTVGVKFSTWLLWSLKEVEDKFRRPGKGVKFLHRCGELDDTIPTKDQTPLQRAAAELSDDAIAIINLVLDTPTDIKLALLDYEGNNSVGLVPKLTTCLVDFLHDIGWCSERIGETFYEIGEALC